jgi:hypothetical protein
MAQSPHLTVREFCSRSTDAVVGALSLASGYDVKSSQLEAWRAEVEIIRTAVEGLEGDVVMEFAVPRLGKRIDAVLILGPLLLVVEFKVGATRFEKEAIEQVWDYALDLKNFHRPSADATIVPVLVATSAQASPLTRPTSRTDNVYDPVCLRPTDLAPFLRRMLAEHQGNPISAADWINGQYWPTPTIVEAATALYRNHRVTDITRSDAGAANLTLTNSALYEIVKRSCSNNRKSICFVTGVPGSGKTLAGLNLATRFLEDSPDMRSVFMSGNGPLVEVLQEALARDSRQGTGSSLSAARRSVQTFIQNVHTFRDDCWRSPNPPAEHVAIFDEAQRAWNSNKTSDFMRRRKNVANWQYSEPEFLISCLDRHPDWAVIICLVGGGQEIHSGEAGLLEWLASLANRFRDWRVHISPNLNQDEYGVADMLDSLPNEVVEDERLHLSVSMRSFRAEQLSRFVQQVLNQDVGAEETLNQFSQKYAVVLTRSLETGKDWLRRNARGTERFGMIASSQAERLRAQGIHVKAPVSPIHWFLNDSNDVRSSYYLEDVATEFHIQGLEVDWSCVVWDADFRFRDRHFENWRFHGNNWQRIRNSESQKYQKNAYRVLLTRARQGMVIVVPDGSDNDWSRKPEFYDETYSYRKSVGLPEL